MPRFCLGLVISLVFMTSIFCTIQASTSFDEKKHQRLQIHDANRALEILDENLCADELIFIAKTDLLQIQSRVERIRRRAVRRLRSLDLPDRQTKKWNAIVKRLDGFSTVISFEIPIYSWGPASWTPHKHEAKMDIRYEFKRNEEGVLQVFFQGVSDRHGNLKGVQSGLEPSWFPNSTKKVRIKVGYPYYLGSPIFSEAIPNIFFPDFELDLKHGIFTFQLYAAVQNASRLLERGPLLYSQSLDLQERFGDSLP